MNLHEFQSKTLFRDFDLPVSSGVAVRSVDEMEAATQHLGGNRWVVKVQIHAGGRGKAGGVRLVDNLTDAQEFADYWLDKHMVTKQTDANGQLVSHIYVESVAEIERELYLGAVIDRSSRRVVVMASTEGGVDIEEVAANTPDLIHRLEIDPFLGAQQHQGRALAYGLKLEGVQIRQFTTIFLNLCKLFSTLDCSLVEVNPLVVTRAGDVHCLDAKVNIDDNALYRQPTLAEMRDLSQEDEREIEAAKFNLSYVSMDGNIGCIVNGAGLAMGTMDIVKLYGGYPANFLDVGGGVDAEAVAEAFKIVLSDSNIKTVLINIFGGIVSCAVIAEGIADAYREVEVPVPVVVRFDGNSAAEGRRVLEESGLDIIAANTLQGAAMKAVEATKGPS